MDTRGVIFLVGMPACGKSTLARALAAAGVARTIDLDEEVERRAGLSVAQIMARHGEAEFRRLEAEAVAAAAAMRPEGGLLVVSTGGGAPCHGRNMDVMLAGGTVVWLQASPERSLQRLVEARGTRPAADRAMEQGRLSEWYHALLAARAPHYARAHATFDTTELDDAPAVAAAVERFRAMIDTQAL
ncbi:MAG: shikimate kinase [Muribaculaceae bacterium]|nr:shikimate kinase [Muribaculaceae bacterium]